MRNLNTDVKTGLVVLGILGLLIFYHWISPKQSDSLRRAELQTLDLVRNRVIDQLAAGQSIPTNWFMLTNGLSYDWQARMIADHYTILQPVTYNGGYRTGAIFLVRSQPWRDGFSCGRWVLVASTNPMIHVWRTLIPLKSMPAEVQSQLGH